MLKIYLKLLQKYRPSKGWTLAELMISAAMTMMVVMVAGLGLVTVLRENKVANATGEMQYDLNRATEFIVDEIRSAKIIETNLYDIRNNAPEFADFMDENPDITPVLALKIDGIYERVVYYVDEVDPKEVWRGPQVIKRFGPPFDGEGTNDGDPNKPNYEDPRRNPDKWKGLALVDMIVLELDERQKDCHDLTRQGEEGTYTDGEGNTWHRLPKATEDVRGFFACVRDDKQLAQINVVGTTLDEFWKLYASEEGQAQQTVRNAKTRHTDKMEYNVVTMAHARSEVVGSSGVGVPRYQINKNTPQIVFEEDGDATIDVLYVNIPCFDNTTSKDVRTNFYKAKGNDIPLGIVEGENRGPSVTFKEDDVVITHIEETRTETELLGCTSSQNTVAYQVNVNDKDLKYVTNDTSQYTKLNDIIPSSVLTDYPGENNFQAIADTLEDQNLVRKASDGTYDFILPDNIVLYFVEFQDQIEEPIFDDEGEFIGYNTQTDAPSFDDAIILVEMTKND